MRKPFCRLHSWARLLLLTLLLLTQVATVRLFPSACARIPCPLAGPADRFRACISRLALARQASRAKQAAALDLGSTVEDFGRLCVLSLVSDELRHCRIVGCV